MLALVLNNKCRQQDDKEPHPRYQWIWERADSDASNPAADTMYWDCLFVARLYKGGALKGISFPTPRALDPLFVAEQRVFAAIKKEVEEIIELVNRLKDKPKGWRCRRCLDGSGNHTRSGGRRGRWRSCQECSRCGGCR